MAEVCPHVVPSDAPPGEKRVFEILKSGPANWTVLHSLDISKHLFKLKGEIDFVVLMPGKGILCVEVKSHDSVTVEAGSWYFGRSKKRQESPFKQVNSAMYSLVEMIKGHGIDFRNVPIASCIVFPFADLQSKPLSVEWNAHQLISHKDFLATGGLLKALEYSLIQEVSEMRNKNPKRFSGKVLGEVKNVLRPSFEMFATPAQRASQAKGDALIFTQKQFKALDAMAVNKRVIFSGLAGTGKTLLAQETLRRYKSQFKRPFMLCYNKNLANFLIEENGDFVSSLHSRMIDWTGLVPPADNQEVFWNATLPDAASKWLAQNGPQFDALVIDEAQDLLGFKYLDVIDKSLEGGLEFGNWTVFGDFENQALYFEGQREAKNGLLFDFQELVGGAPIYILRENCRNTPKVGYAVQYHSKLNPEYSDFLRPNQSSHPDPAFHFYSSEVEMLQKVADGISQAVKEGYKQEDMVLLWRNNEVLSVLSAELLLIPYGKTSSGKAIRHASIHSFKGLESPVVFLVGIDNIKSESGRELLYVGASRAILKLEVFARAATKNQFLS